MDYDEEKVDEFTLALLYLVVHDRKKNLGQEPGRVLIGTQ
jgi:hypothetical protein